MRILALEICKKGSPLKSLLPIIVLMVCISCSQVSAPFPHSATLVSSLPLTNSTTAITATWRPWPSDEFLRSIIDGNTHNESNAYPATLEKQNNGKEILSGESTIRALNTPSISFSFPLQTSGQTSRKSDSFDYAMENRGNHWQRLNKTGIIIADRRKEPLYKSPSFGWFHGDAELPVGFSRLTWNPQRVATPYTPTGTAVYQNYGSTGRPLVIYNPAPPPISDYKWHYPQTQTPEINTRPSIVIVKDKVSSVHWGSSGSTLPPPQQPQQEYQYLHTPTISPIQSTPYNVYGSESGAVSTIYSQTPTSVWYKPAIHHYTTTTIAPILTANPGLQQNKNIMFKIWSYLNDGSLKLHGEKEIPAVILKGHPIKDGDILNFAEIPVPIRQLVSSSLSHHAVQGHGWDRNTVTTSNYDGQWQKLPILVPTSTPSGWDWGSPPVKEKPVSLNYVIWGSSTTTPSPPTILPPPGDYQKYLQEYLTRFATPAPPKQDSNADAWLIVQNYFLSQMSTQIPILQGQTPLKNASPEDLANMAILQMILTNLNKQADVPQSPKTPTQSSADITRLRPPHRNSFWSSLYPIYQYLLSKRIKIPSVIRGESGDTTVPLTGFQNGVDFDQASVFGNSYSQSNDYPISITESYPNIYPNNGLVTKTGKAYSKKRRRRKKCKHKYHHGHGWGLLDHFGVGPGNLDLNYNFKVDFMDLLRKKFFALLALKLAPIIILSIAAVTPLAFLVWPQVFKHFKGYFSGHNHKSHHHHSHLHPFHHYGHPHRLETQTQVEHPIEIPYIPDYQQQQYYNPYQDQVSLSDSSGKFQSIMQPEPKNRKGFQSNPALHVASLVQKNFGDKSLNPAQSDWIGILTTTPSPYMHYSDSTLDTEYNRRVMDVLMKNKNHIHPRIPHGRPTYSPAAIN